MDHQCFDVDQGNLKKMKAEDGVQHLIPMAKEIVREVDVEGRRIAIEALPGLLGPDTADPTDS